jgi:mitochondrial protein import protein ZIM17
MKPSYQSLLRPFSLRFRAPLRAAVSPFAPRHFHQQSSFPRPQSIARTPRRPSTACPTPLPSRRHESGLVASGQDTQPLQDLQPAYQLTFTCKPCKTRSAHRVTKQGYHHGTTLITCPGCKSRHLISDHLKIFSDHRITLEDILEKQLEDGRPLADLLKKGKLGIRQGSIVGIEGEEDLEFWEDGTETSHEKAPVEESRPSEQGS